MPTSKIFNFLVMLIETDVFIRKFIKRIEINMNIGNFIKWIEISVSIQIVGIEVSLVIQNTV